MKLKFIFFVLIFSFLFIIPKQTYASQYILINKATNQLALFENGKLVKVFPVATGKSPELTPEGIFKIVNKVIKPVYCKLKIPGGSPNNPLGLRWLGIGGVYGIHGTNDPESIGDN
ncbi:MAG: L,D-transpeptidase [Desulfotomaculum sp.]|nr:L,D-transpeptidase [Desulfotomaculum sp.]